MPLEPYDAANVKVDGDDADGLVNGGMYIIRFK